MRKVYFVTTVLLLISVVFQFYFAALGVFGPQGEDDNLYVFHSVNGQFVLPALALLAVLFAALSRAGARTVWLTALPILLVAVQILLFILAGAIGGGDRGQPDGGKCDHPRAPRRQRDHHPGHDHHADDPCTRARVPQGRVRRRDADRSLMSSLSGAWLALSLVQLVAFGGACVLGAGVGKIGRSTRALAIAALAIVGVVAAIAAIAIAVSLVAVDWAWGAEKLLVAGPIGAVSALIAAAFAVRDVIRARRGEPAEPILFGILISAAIGAVVGPVALLLIGSVVTWQAELAVVLVWLSGSAVALLATAGIRRRAVVSAGAFAGLSVALLALFTVFGPTIATASSGGHHLPPAPGVDAPTVSVADLRETDTAGPAGPSVRPRGAPPDDHPAGRLGVRRRDLRLGARSRARRHGG